MPRSKSKPSVPSSEVFFWTGTARPSQPRRGGLGLLGGDRSRLDLSNPAGSNNYWGKTLTHSEGKSASTDYLL